MRNAGGRLTFLAPNEWQLAHAVEERPEVRFYETTEHIGFKGSESL